MRTSCCAITRRTSLTYCVVVVRSASRDMGALRSQQAGARSVSQPPAPGTEPRPVMLQYAPRTDRWRAKRRLGLNLSFLHGLVSAGLQCINPNNDKRMPVKRMSGQLSPEASALVDKILYYRGATILAFAQVEWFLARIILEAGAFDEYTGVDRSFSQDAEKRAAVVKRLLNVQGAFSPYADELRKAIDNVMRYAELRNLSAHGL